jgi:sortase A
MRDARHVRRSRGAGVLGWMARLFIMGGAAALVWCVFVLADVDKVQRSGREMLDATPLITESPSGSPSSSGSESAPPQLTPGTPLAELSIPRLGLSAVVLHGSDAHTLQLGLGHIENTPVPGQSGNVAIAGHRDSFFRPLRNVQVGDDILLQTPEESLHYRVSSFRVVNPYEVDVIGPTKDATLTLVTCYPFWFIGPAPDRFIVHAMRVENPMAAAPRPVVVQTGKPHRVSVIDGTPTASANSVATRTAGGANESTGARSTEAGASRPADRAISSESMVRGATDDDARVREVVERFRLAYNARLGVGAEVGGDGPITFQACEISSGEGMATATCNASLRSLQPFSSSAWIFKLVSLSGEWTITSVGTN